MPTVTTPNATTGHLPNGRKRVERRRATRFPCGLGTSRHLTAKLQSDGSENAVVALVRNISATGISLLVNGPLEPGSIMTVELCHLRRFWCTYVAIRIVYAVWHPEGQFVIGAAFTRELTADEIGGLLGDARP